jgi:hypothetical protein
MRHIDTIDRRGFIAVGAAALAIGQGRPQHPRVNPPPRPKPPEKKLAVVTTAYHYLSHAYHICGRFFDGYLRGKKYHFPNWSIAGMFVDQKKANDLSRQLSIRHGFALKDTVRQSLTLGTQDLAVDGVLLIAEHGDYPYNARLQKLYPRHELFQKIVEVFRQSKKVVPVFCDKHLSYDRGQAAEMVETAHTMKFPLMAGSSLPITWRRPELEVELGSRIERGLVVTRGEIEIFGFHGLEALQCMMERRHGGETGVRTVRCLLGQAVWDFLDRDRSWHDLLEAALSRSPSRNNGNMRENCSHFDPPPGRPTFLKGPIAFLITYQDGTPALVLNLNGHVDDTTFAGKVNGKIESTLFYLPPPPGAAFLEALTMHVESFLETKKPAVPIERTLLTSVVLDAVLESRLQDARPIDLTKYKIRYEAPRDSGFVRGDYVETGK